MRRPIPVLLYHRVTEEALPFSSTPKLFEQHMSWLDTKGYRTLTLQELRQRIESGSGSDESTGREIVITFDDGYSELGVGVADTLRRHGFTAAAFLITSRCPEDDFASGEYLSWTQARALADEGVYEFHSHTHSHEKWPLDAGQASAVAADIATASATLSDQLQRPATAFDHLAWPFGRTCSAWENEARAHGAPVQYVVQRGAVTKPGQIDRLPRLLVDGMGLRPFTMWVTLLSSRPGALGANRVFGMIRDRRQGGAYL